MERNRTTENRVEFHRRVRKMLACHVQTAPVHGRHFAALDSADEGVDNHKMGYTMLSHIRIHGQHSATRTTSSDVDPGAQRLRDHVREEDRHLRERLRDVPAHRCRWSRVEERCDAVQALGRMIDGDDFMVQSFDGLMVYKYSYTALGPSASWRVAGLCPRGASMQLLRAIPHVSSPGTENVLRLNGNTRTFSRLRSRSCSGFARARHMLNRCAGAAERRRAVGVRSRPLSAAVGVRSRPLRAAAFESLRGGST